MARVEVVVILCAILGAASAYYGYHYHSHRHNHQVSCWRQQGCARRGPPICERWCIVFVTVGGFCQQARYQCCGYREKLGYCPSVQPICAWTMPYFFTKYYECSHDYNCPVGYKCCQDSCFAHKICKPCTILPPQPPLTTTFGTRDTEEISVWSIVTTTNEQPSSTTTTVQPTTTTTTEQPTTTTTTKQPTTTTTQATTTEEIITDTTPVIEPEESTTELLTTTTAVEIEETTAEETVTTTVLEETTTVKIQEPDTTTAFPIKPQTSAPVTTTEEMEGSGSGNFEVPEPEAARVLNSLIDDEDFNRYGDYAVY